MPLNHPARTLLRAAVARVARSLVRQADGQLSTSMVAEHLEQRQMLARVNGLDVTHFQGTINWTNVRAAGYEFAYEKATEGVGVLDSALTTNMSGGAAAGVLMGAFHYAQPDTSANDAVNEANYFVAQAGKYMKGGWLRPAVQIDTGSTLGKTALSTWVNTFVSTVQSATGVTPLVYATTDYATNYLNSTVANKNLWIANYNYSSAQAQGSSSPPTGSWGSSGSSWTTWRYNASGTVSGVTGNTTDLDVFNGDRTALQSLVIAPPANPFQLNIDFGPATPAAPAGYVGVGSQVYGSLGGYTMGWTTSGVTTYARTGGTAPDDRYRTYAMPALGGVSRSFEVAVPNGSYTVRVVTGSPDQTGNAQKIVVEGTTAVNASTSASTPFISGTVTVNVTDGKLTLSGDYNGWANTRLDFVDIVAGGRAAAPPAAPSAVTASRPTGTSVALTWQDNADNEGSFPASFTSATWGEVNRGYEIKRRTSTNGVWSGWTSIGYALSNATAYTDTTADAGTTYQYRVTAINSTGKSSEIESATVPPKVAPSIAGPSTINEGSTYTLMLAVASGSSPVTGWSINWGDGTVAEAVGGTANSATHVFARGPLAYTISATASDSTSTYAAGNTVIVQVVDVAPTLHPFPEDPFVAAGGSTKVPLGSFSDAGFGNGETFSVSIDWGDGTPAGSGIASINVQGHAGLATSGTLSGTHIYAQSGTFNVLITLTDAGGATTSAPMTLFVQSAPAPYLVPGAPGSTTLVSFTVTSDEHSSGQQNELGLFFVDDVNYTIGTHAAGGTTNADYVNYAMAALTDPSRHIAVPRNAPTGTTHSYLLPAGKYVAFYMVQDASTSDFINGTFPSNYTGYNHSLIDSSRPNVFFMNPVANFDHFQHVRPSTSSPGVERYGWEDLVGGGDQDFNDIVFTLSASGAPELTATANNTAGAIDLAWTPATDEHGYRIFRGTSETALSPFKDVVQGVTSYADASAAIGTTYYYAVAPLAANGLPAARSLVKHAVLIAAATLPGSIAGSVWNDANGDSSRGADEPAMAGVRVYLDENSNGNYDSNEPSAITDAAGHYALADVALGIHALRAVSPTGWAASFPASGTYSVPIGGGEAYSGKDFAFKQLNDATDPPDLTASADAQSGTIQLHWTESYSNDDGFIVERSTDGLSFSQVADLPGANQTSFTDADVQISTPYYYRVRAYNHGPEGHREYYDYSNIGTAMLDVPNGEMAPILTARGTIEGVNLNWTDNALNESAWVIERRTVTGSFAQVAQLDGNTIYWTDHDVTPGTRYFYRVRARVGSSFKLWSNEASALPLTGGGTWYYNSFDYNPKDWEEWSTRSQFTTPVTKRRVLGAFRNHDQATLTWTLPKHDGVTLDFDFYASGTWDGDQMNGGERWIIDIDGQKFYSHGIEISGDTRGQEGPGQLVERARDGSHWIMYHLTLPFAHVDPKISVTFRLDQNYGDEWGTDDEEWYIDNVRLSEGASQGSGDLPDAPTNVQVGQSTASFARVAWTPSISPNVIRYDVYKSTFPDFPADSSSYTGGIGADHSIFDAQFPENAQTVYFKVVAVTRQEGRSLPSAEASFTLGSPLVAPVAPTNLHLAGGGATADAVPLEWSDESNNENQFIIERSSDGVSWGDDEFYSAVIGSVETNVSKFVDKFFGGTADTFFYRVEAENAVGASSYSSVLEVHVPPPAPGTLRVSPSGESDLRLDWAWSGFPATSFTIERSTLPTFPSPDLVATLAAAAGGTSFSYTDEGLDGNVKYYYRITANGQFADTGGSLPAYGVGIVTGDQTPPPTPTGLSYKQEPEGVTLTWDPSDAADGVVGYRVYRVENGSWHAMQGLGQVVDLNIPWWSDLDDAIAPFTRYGVSAVDANLNESEMAQVVIGQIGDGAPANPTGVDAKSFPQAVQLTWDQGSEADLAGWNVYEQVDHYDGIRAPAWVKLNGELITDTLGYNDYEATPGETRVYRITAVDLKGLESDGAIVTQYRAFGAEPPAPTRVQASAAPSGQVRLSWNAVAPVSNQGDAGDALAGYSIYIERFNYGENQNYWQKIATTNATTTSQLIASGSYGDFDSATNRGGQFKFGVATLTADGDISDIVPIGYRVVYGQAPVTPTLANSSKTTDIAQFSWIAGSGGSSTDRWQIFRSKGDGEYEFVKELVLANSTFSDFNLSPSKEYSYRVYALDGDSDFSEPLEISITTDGVPQEPPRVRIVSPALAAGGSYPIVSSDSTVTGYVDDLNGDAVTWSLRLKSVGAPDALDVLLSSGTSEAGEFRNGVGDVLANLGTVLAGQLPNGVYDLILTASDAQSASSPPSSTVRIQLKTDFKLGSFHLPITDLSVDVPGGEPMQIVRSYDSDSAGTAGDFGYGWKLDLSNTNIRTSAQDKPGTSNHTQSGVAAYTASSKDSTLFYVTMPGGQEHVFKFTPYPINYNPVISVDPYSIGYTGSTYVPRFVAVDGSSATLTDPSGADDYLRRDPETGELFEYETYRPYNPARTSAATFSLREADGTVYEVAAQSGQIKTKTDLAGNVTSFNGNGVTSSDKSLYIHRSGNANLIDWVAIQTGSVTPTAADAVLVYSYNPAGELTGVLDTRTNIRTYYEYGTIGGRDHYLKVVRNPQGTPVVNVDYDAATGRLNKVLDAKGNVTSVGQSSVTSSGTSQRINAPGTNGDKVERFYDSAGNVTREIRGIRAANGDVAKYIVTVHSYAYATAFDVQDAMDSGVSMVNALYGQSDYMPHEISGPDTEGARYSWQPTSDDLQSGQTFYIGDASSTDFKQLATATSRLANGRIQNTAFFDYKNGRPQKIVTGDGRKNTTSWNVYDDHGNVVFSIDQEGFGSHNFYDYTGIYGTKGLLLKSDHIHVPITNVNGYDPMAQYAASGSNETIANVEVLYQQVLNTYFTGNETGAAGIGKYRGRLKSTTDVSGKTTYFHYDADGNTIRTFSRWQGSGGQDKWVVSYSDFDAADRVTKSGTRVYLNNGGDGTATFDPSSDSLASDVVGQQTFFDANGRVDHTLDTYGQRTQNFYDQSGNLVRVLYSDKTETRTVFDDQGRTVWTSDRFYSGLTYDQTSAAQLNASTFTAVATKTIYDSAGRAIGTERYRDVMISIAVTSGAFAGNAFAFYDAAAPTVASSQEIASTSTTLDANGRATAQSSTDIATGLTTTQQTEYYLDGRVKRSRTVGSDASATGWTNYAYGEIDKNDHRYDSVTDGLNATTTTFTDEMGRAVQVVDANGHSKNTVYWERQSTTPIDAQYAPPARIANDATWTRQEVSIDELGAQTSRFYDAAGRLRFVLLPDPDGTAGPLTAGVWEYTYDAYGNQTSQIDPKGHTTSFAYDEQGRRVSRTLPADGDGNAANDTEYWTYDASGRTKTHVDFKGQVTAYVYDDDSSLALTGGDPRLAIAADRPVLGRLVEERRYVSVASFNNGAGTPAETTRYGYDDLGRQSAVAEYNGATSGTYQRLATTDYDSVTGNVSIASSPEGTIHYEYDAATGQLRRTWTASNDTTDVYDAVGRLKSVKTNVLNGVTHATPIVTTYGYTATGNLDWMLDDNGTATTADDVFTDYGYDRVGRLTSETVTRGGTVSQAAGTVSGGASVFSQAFVLDDAGNRRHVDERRDGAAWSTTDWTYDFQGRLTDEVYNRAVDNTKDYAAHFAFDAAGNRTSKTQTGYESGAWAYTYYDRDELHTDIETGANAHSYAYAYDANGSQTLKTGDGPNQTYAWDLRNRMSSATVAGVTTTYGYDSGGQRVSEHVGTDAIRTLLQDKNDATGYPQTLEERLGTTLDRSYRIGLGVLGQADATGTFEFVRDTHSSDRLMLDAATGNEVGKYDFQAYGEPIGFDAEAARTTELFAGDGEYDSSTGLYYRDARWGRDFTFTSYDSFEAGPGDESNLNKYLYASNNPLEWSDSSGNSLAETLLVGAFRVGMYASSTLNVGLAYASTWTIFHPIAATVISAGIAASGLYLYAADKEFQDFVNAQPDAGHFVAGEVNALFEAANNVAKFATGAAARAEYAYKMREILRATSSKSVIDDYSTIAVGKLEIDGGGEILRVANSGRRSAAGTVETPLPEQMQISMPSTKIRDAERKLFEQYLKITDRSTSATLRITATYASGMCDSCVEAARVFQEMRPNIKVVQETPVKVRNPLQP